MAETLATMATTIAGELVRSDLTTEIKTEIGNVIRHLNTEPFAFTELRDGELATVADQSFYGTVDFSSASGPQTGLVSTSVQDIVDIDWMKVAQSGQRWQVDKISYRQFEELREGVSTSTVPSYYCVYGGQIGLWPTPSAVYTVEISARVKAAVPTGDSDTSVWFERAGELVREMTAERILRKHIRDNEGAFARAAGARELVASLRLESALQRATGRTTPTRL